MKKLVTLILAVFVEENGQTISNGMAVPKSRRSKTKGKIRLANWKRKANGAAKKAFNEAKKVFAKDKKEESAINEEAIDMEKDLNGEEN